MGMGERAMDRMLGKTADPKRNHPLYNTSPFTFQTLLGDSANIAPSLVAYINGIFNYVWLVTNRKAPERRGKVQLINGTRFYQKMKKSLNNKRNEITKDQIRFLTRVYGNFQDGETAPDGIEFSIDGAPETRVISRVFDNREFGFLKVTVERPLRMNFEARVERIARLDDQTAFANLAVSKKRKDKALAEREEAGGRKQQDAIRTLLATLESKGRYMDRAKLDADLSTAAKQADVKLPAPIKKAIFAALGERDPAAEICRDSKGRPEPDSELRDTENIPLPPRHDAAAAHGVRAGQAQRSAGQGVQGQHRCLHRARGPAPCA